MEVFTIIHWIGTKHVIRYLKGILSLGLTMCSSYNLKLYVFDDSDWTGLPS